MVGVSCRCCIRAFSDIGDASWGKTLGQDPGRWK
ncbi:hypothetical protein FVEG_14881 [Fusarium verticillioides 7600]|uniref:Uncharacterized protein n=1 Tax=Gibberella moniliformis (strain M3125 / FGSC 7600) TaxID=334819 RepID=W7LG71_GIBM7|nr:hypothetical protein FVEG_14881 [Fusarium verticillioides 7600]EWG38403.1 hypothetical protein FVEG_14881 [Fusarium verticillioides 7600]